MYVVLARYLNGLEMGDPVINQYVEMREGGGKVAAGDGALPCKSFSYPALMRERPAERTHTTGWMSIILAHECVGTYVCVKRRWSACLFAYGAYLHA